MRLCKNCRRDKLEVARRRRPDADAATWRVQVYCIDCGLMPCTDIGPGPEDKCELPQAVLVPGEDPPTWLGWCRQHHHEHTVCNKRGCGKAKPVWDTLCPECRQKADTKALRRQVWNLRATGDLCPGCRTAPIHHPQSWCISCLRARGITPWRLNTSISDREARREAVLARRAKWREINTEKLRRKKWLESRPPPPERRRFVKRKVLPDPEPVPEPKRAPRGYVRPLNPAQRKWKKAYWTGWGKKPFEVKNGHPPPVDPQRTGHLQDHDPA